MSWFDQLDGYNLCIISTLIVLVITGRKMVSLIREKKYFVATFSPIFPQKWDAYYRNGQ